MGRFSSQSLCACALVLGLMPARALAWTRANVESAQARIELEDSGRALVTLALEIRVTGGWLSRFELTGLERDIVLEPERPALVHAADGETLLPSVKLRKDGSALFLFAEKKRAPHRGLHRLEFSYRTTLDALELPNAGAVGLSWSMPAWEADLRHASIEVSGPKALRAARAIDADPAVVRTQTTRGEHTLVRFERAQLPRTVSFSAPLELPSLEPAQRARAAVGHAARGTFTVAALVFALALLKRKSARALGRALGGRPIAWIPLGERPRTVGIALACALGGLGYEARPALALGVLACAISLALDRGFLRIDRQPSTTRLPARALLSTASWLDATTPLGAGLLGSAYALAALRLALGAAPGPWLECLLLLTPLFLTATRLHGVRSPALRTGVPRAGSGSGSNAAELSADAARRAPDRAA